MLRLLSISTDKAQTKQESSPTTLLLSSRSPNKLQPQLLTNWTENLADGLMNLSAISLMAGPTPVTREEEQEMSVLMAGKHQKNASAHSITTAITSMNAQH